MNSEIERIKKAIEPLRNQIIKHPVYQAIGGVKDLQVFMEYHLFAVWDFMSLLKSLQNNLTCTSIPWFPTGEANTRYLINEIVIGEESDVDAHGIRKSHFEIYLDAMEQIGANKQGILSFLEALKATNSLEMAFEQAHVPKAIAEFVNTTFDIIHSQKPHLQAAVFTFGREDLIPDMFLSIVNDLNKSEQDRMSTFKYYLERHIEVDGGHHSHLALQMVESLCGNDSKLWKEATEAIIECLQKRIELWDGALVGIRG